VNTYSLERIKYLKEKSNIAAIITKPVNPFRLFDVIVEVWVRQILKPDRTDLKPKRKLVKRKCFDKGSEETLRGARILLVEDNSMNQMVARRTLENIGLVVSIANNGKEAVTAILQSVSGAVDAVLMDIQMPQMDGYEATRVIRQDPRFHDLPIIAVTAHAMAGDRDKCLEAGMSDYISKPIDVQQMFSCLSKWIRPKMGSAFSSLPGISQAQSEDTAVNDGISESLPGFDIESALARLGGNEKLYRELLEEFYQQHKNIGAEIREALNKGDARTAKQLTHTLKGMAGNLSAYELHKVAGDLENSIKKAYYVDCALCMDKLEKSLAFTLESIRQLKTDQPAPQAAASAVMPETDELVPVFNELLELLKQNNIRAEEVLEKLTECLNFAGVEQYLLQIKTELSEFNFKAAQHSLLTIAKTTGVPIDPPEESIHVKDFNS
ncbi:MAG TPA: response regulator, partial [Thermodesulfovibrionia bacterium]|nr:response regulator [Thermodesulfovibrionia bacterium]